MDAIAKTCSNYDKHLNSVRRKWRKDIDNVRLLKFESKQLHQLCTKLINEGRLTLDELRANVNSRVEAKELLKIK
jgi:hypothetical protein